MLALRRLRQGTNTNAAHLEIWKEETGAAQGGFQGNRIGNQIFGSPKRTEKITAKGTMF